MSGGWFRSQADGPDGWEARAAWLIEHANGDPWESGFAIDDLRWWQDRVLAPGSRCEFPGYRYFAARWGWGEKRARLLLQNEERWSDPYRLKEWREYQGRSKGALGAQQGRAKGSVGVASPEIIHDSGRGEGARRAHLGRAKGDTRLDLDPPSPSPSPMQLGDTREHHPLSPMLITQPGIERSPLFEAPPPVEEPAPVVVGEAAPAAEAKPKRKRTAKKAPTDAVKAISDLWARVWRETHSGRAYAWSWRYDQANIEALLEGVDRDADGAPLPGELVRLERAFRTYIAAADANDPLCKGYPAKVQGFRIGFADWMQRADEEADFKAYMAQYGPPVRPIPLWKQWEREDRALIAAGLPPKTKLPRRNLADVPGSMAWHMRKLEEESRGAK